MSVSDKSTVLSSFSSVPGGETDPLLKDLNEKKQSFRRNVVSLAAELKEVRSRLASKEQSFAKETLTRQASNWILRLFFCGFPNKVFHFLFNHLISLFGIFFLVGFFHGFKW